MLSSATRFNLKTPVPINFQACGPDFRPFCESACESFLVHVSRWGTNLTLCLLEFLCMLCETQRPEQTTPSSCCVLKTNTHIYEMRWFIYSQWCVPESWKGLPALSLSRSEKGWMESWCETQTLRQNSALASLFLSLRGSFACEILSATGKNAPWMVSKKGWRVRWDMRLVCNHSKSAQMRRS